MRLFDSMGKDLIGQLAGGGRQSNLMGAVAQLLTSSNVGGLGGLAQLFQKQGHGETMNSWISSGENRPISPEALQGVLGQERIQHAFSRSPTAQACPSRKRHKAFPASCRSWLTRKVAGA